ncbi:glycosyltransferase family 4 protein [Chryseobacterium turcicum]|uniref:Glycosyltransferase family 4 protein n=1 Tax=Chryseobacterium turcicum TaxID=2898076 RepID=A0A9Q3V0A1_9FLAO|nr:glycosyltransferase family 4 protein [Chryseobacterium turcicum]MCD1116499.1 glycosyltransferase family 4 protein [Chryseobacterium turcicum]
MKVVFLSTFAFDANISLINALKNKCDIYFFTEALYEIDNYLDKNKLSEFLSVGTDVQEIQRFSELIPLDKTFVIKGTRQINVVKKLYNSYRIDKKIREINPDLIILDSHLITYFFTAFRYSKKSLLIVHDPFFHSGENFKADILLRKLYFSLVENKILLNKNQKNDFINHYKQDSNKIFTSFLSVYEYLTFYGGINDKKNTSFNVLFFGRISPYKGVKYFLDACVEIIESGQYPNISFTVAGSGDFDFDITKYYNYSQIKIINKFIQPEELSQFIKSSSVVVCPYVDATQSGVVMSCFAFKKPVIATNVGGLPEMVEDGKTGVIIEPKSTESIKEAIFKLYENPQILEQMSENIAQEYLYGEKSWSQSGEYFIDAINSIIKK